MFVGVWVAISCGRFRTHKNPNLNMGSYLGHSVLWLYGRKQRNPQSIKILENSHTKNWRLKIYILDIRYMQCFNIYAFYAFIKQMWEVLFPLFYPITFLICLVFSRDNIKKIKLINSPESCLLIIFSVKTLYLFCFTFTSFCLYPFKLT